MFLKVTVRVEEEEEPLAMREEGERLTEERLESAELGEKEMEVVMLPSPVGEEMEILFNPEA